MGYNLAALPFADRRRIELDKQAHLLIWKRRNKKIGRAPIVAAIDDVEEENREWFRDRLNDINERSSGKSS
ncbi:DUF3283 family protein [Aeromonas enteropelogenes]|uniref:DUF3283 family protein n=1 Tax=Aeromonas enteropelogenes TaxID=29489 RepID=UPI003BA0C1A2